MLKAKQNKSPKIRTNPLVDRNKQIAVAKFTQKLLTVKSIDPDNALNLLNSQELSECLQANYSYAKLYSLIIYYELGKYFAKHRNYYAALSAYTSAYWHHASRLGDTFLMKTLFSKQKGKSKQKIADRIPNYEDIISQIYNVQLNLSTYENSSSFQTPEITNELLDLVSNYRLLTLGNEHFPEICNSVMESLYNNYCQENNLADTQELKQFCYSLMTTSMISIEFFLIKSNLQNDLEKLRIKLKENLKNTNLKKFKNFALSNFDKSFNAHSLLLNKKTPLYDAALIGKMLLSVLTLILTYVFFQNWTTLLLCAPTFIIFIISAIHIAEHFMDIMQQNFDNTNFLFDLMSKIYDFGFIKNNLELISITPKQKSNAPTTNNVHALMPSNIYNDLAPYFYANNVSCNSVKKLKYPKTSSNNKASSSLTFYKPEQKQRLERIEWQCGKVYDPTDPQCDIYPFYRGDKVAGYIFIKIAKNKHEKNAQPIIDEFYNHCSELKIGADDKSYRILLIEPNPKNKIHGIKFTGKKTNDLRLYGSIFEKSSNPGQNLYVLSGIYSHKNVDTPQFREEILAATQKIKNETENNACSSSTIFNNG